MTGKFEIELEGVAYIGKFGIGAFEALCDENDIEFFLLQSKLESNPLLIIELTYHACKVYAEIKGIEFNVNKLIFKELLSDDQTKQLQKVSTALAKSYVLGVGLGGEAPAQKGTAKKK